MSDIIYGAMLAFQVAAVGYDDGAENRIFLLEKNCFEPEICEIKK